MMRRFYRRSLPTPSEVVRIEQERERTRATRSVHYQLGSTTSPLIQPDYSSRLTKVLLWIFGIAAAALIVATVVQSFG